MRVGRDPADRTAAPGATREGYQRSERASQSTPGPHARANGLASGVPSHQSCARRHVLTDQIGAGAWARSGAPGTAATAAGSRPSGRTTDRAGTTPPALDRFVTRAGGARPAPARRPADAHGRRSRGPRRCSRWTWCAAAASSSCSERHGPLPEAYVPRDPRADARGARRRARGRGGAPRRQAGQPPARADRHRTAVGAARRLRGRRGGGRRTADADARGRRHRRLHGARAGHRRPA